MASGAVAGCVTGRFAAGCCLAAAVCLAVACSRAATDVKVTWKIDPTPPISGAPTVVQVIVIDPSGQPASGAKLRLEAHMSHPGMAPVTADIVERQSGSYDARLVLSMPGDWVFVVNGVLADRTWISREIKVPGVRGS